MQSVTFVQIKQKVNKRFENCSFSYFGDIVAVK